MVTMSEWRVVRVKDIHCRERGSGPILLCLHGICSSGASFAAQLAGLGTNRRVVAWDAPGFGESADPAEAPGPDGYAATVVDLIERLGAPVHLLGVAWGAAIACQVAHDRPELLRSLVLISAGRGDKENPQAAEALRQRVGQLEEVGPQRFAEATVPRLMAGSIGATELAEAVGATAAAVRLPGYAHAVDALITTDLRPVLAHIQVPTLVLCGDQDPITGEAESRALHAGIVNSVQVTVAGAGHLASQDQPDSVNEWIAGYLDIVEHLEAEKEPVHVG